MKQKFFLLLQLLMELTSILLELARILKDWF